METIKPQPSEELPSPVSPNDSPIPFEQKYRGFNDDFTVYKIDSHLIPIPRLSYMMSKKLKVIGTEFDKKMIEFVKNSLNESSGSMLDSEDKFLDDIADFLFPKQKEEIFNDVNVSRATLFRSCKDLFSFLMANGTSQEERLSREQ